MTGSNNSLVPGGYEPLFDSPNLRVSPDIAFDSSPVSPTLGYTGPAYLSKPAMDRGFGSIYRGNYNPLNPAGWAFQPPAAPTQAVQPASTAQAAQAAPADDPYPDPLNFYNPKAGPMTLDERKAFDAAITAWAARNQGVVPRP